MPTLSSSGQLPAVEDAVKRHINIFTPKRQVMCIKPNAEAVTTKLLCKINGMRVSCVYQRLRP